MSLKFLYNRVKFSKYFFSPLFCTPTWPLWRQVQTKNAASQPGSRAFLRTALSSAKKSPGNEFDRQDMLHQTSDLIGL